MSRPGFKSVCILYGWSEGSWHGRKLRHNLKTLNFLITKKATEADIIISHSGGAFLIPANHRASLILMIGLPNWPRHPVLRLPLKIAQDIRYLKSKRHFFIKTFFNLAYIIFKVLYNTKIWLGWRKPSLPTSHAACKVVALRNEHDAFMHAKTSLKQAEDNGWVGLTLLGASHDDVWLNPQPYTQILEKFIES
jgi:hypothetical protein